MNEPLLYFLVFSCTTLALFLVFLYLMTVVDPGHREVSSGIMMKIMEAETALVPNIYSSDRLPTHYSIGYGLEKIPEGVDADEFRKKLMTTEHNDHVDRASIERGQRVVPPIWPREIITGNKENAMKAVNNSYSKSPFETYSPAKGLRRSVNDNKISYKLGSLGSVFLNVINEGGRKKIEIKFISREEIKEKEIKLQSSNLNTTDSRDSTLILRANDTIILTIGDDSDVFADVIGDESTEQQDKRIYSNKTLSSTKPINRQKADKEFAKELVNNEIYILNLLANSDNSTDGSLPVSVTSE